MSPPAGKSDKLGSAPVSSKHTEGRTYSTTNEDGFAAIQATGPVYIGSPRGTGWFPALEVRMNPHKQGPSPQNWPRIDLALTWVAEPWPAIWTGDIGCSGTASVPGQNGIRVRECDGRELSRWISLLYPKTHRVFIEIPCLFTELILGLSWNYLMSNIKTQ